jgi:hypothetical protein
MSFDEHMARAAECQQKAKLARSHCDKLSWLTLADSWLKTAELQTPAAAVPIPQGHGVTLSYSTVANALKYPAGIYGQS